MSDPTERFRVLRSLGRGGFGEVQLVYDTERQQQVALKRLHLDGAGSHAPLRREFRVLSALPHPNIVALHELHINGDAAFFTMEPIEGVDAVSWVRPVEGLERLAAVKRLCAQIIDALDAMHGKGVLHRDLKPANVLVTPAGRAVLLDAGLAQHLNSQESSPERICGTMAYMAPEQATRTRLTPASDRYALGVMLFEMLAGANPFAAKNLAVLLQRKLHGETPQLSEWCPWLPDDDARFLQRLLDRAPTARPDSDEIRRWCDASAPARQPRGDAVFVGREGELAVLDGHLATARAAAGLRVVWLEGPAGIGKSALLRAWRTRHAPDPAVWTLTDRCFQRERTPLNGLAGVLGQLVDALDAGDADTAALHAELAALLGRGLSLESAGASLDGPPRNAGAFQRRRRSRAAVAQALEHASAGRTVALSIDDIQWAAQDLAYLLLGLAQSPPSGGLLLLLAARPTPGDGGRVRGVLEPALPPGAAQPLPLGPLQPEAAAALWAARLPDADAPESPAGLVHPFLIEMLARVSTEPDVGEPDLAALVLRWTAGLGVARQRLLEVVCVAAHPVPGAVALRAVEPGASESDVSALLERGLLLRLGPLGADLAPVHDLVREVVVSELDDAQRGGHHLALANALRSGGTAPPELLVTHYMAAGQAHTAAEFVLDAARSQMRSLSFSRAAELFRLSEQLLSVHDESALTPAVRLETARALSLAGRSAESARALLEIAGEVPEDQRRSLEAEAANALIRAGHIEEGLDRAARTLRQLGIRLARSGFAALPHIVLSRLRVWLSGLRYHLAAATHPDPSTLARIDWCQSLALVLPLIDTMRGLQVHDQGLLAALRAGEPARLSRSLAMEAGYQVAFSGGRDEKGRAAGILDTASKLATLSGDAMSLATVDLMRGSACWSAGDWKGCLDHTTAGLMRLRTTPVASSWEINFGETHRINALSWMGQLARHRVAYRTALSDARERGDRYAEMMFTLRDHNLALLVEDRLDEARQTVEVLARWSTPGFQIERLVELYQQTEADLYAGEADAAVARLDRTWGRLQRSQLLRMQAFRIELRALRARAHLLRAAPERGDLRTARRLLQALRKERPSPRGAVLTPGIEAGLAAAEGRAGDAIAAATDGIVQAEAHHMQLHAAALRFAVGRLQGGDDGAVRHRSAEAWMREAGVRKPDRYARMLCPGFPAG